MVSWEMPLAPWREFIAQEKPTSLSALGPAAGSTNEPLDCGGLKPGARLRRWRCTRCATTLGSSKQLRWKWRCQVFFVCLSFGVPRTLLHRISLLKAPKSSMEAQL